MLEFGSKWGLFYCKNWVLSLIVDKFFGHKHVPSSLPRITSESCLFAVKPHCPGFFAALFKWSGFPPAARKISWYPLIGHKYPPKKKSQNQKSWATSTRPSLAASMLNWNFFRLTSPGCFGWSVWHIKNISYRRSLGALSFEPTWTKCVVFYLCVVCSRSHIFLGASRFGRSQTISQHRTFLPWSNFQFSYFTLDQLSVQTSFRSDARKRLRQHPSRLDSECFAMSQNPQKIRWKQRSSIQTIVVNKFRRGLKHI